MAFPVGGSGMTTHSSSPALSKRARVDGFAFYNNQYEGGVCDGHMVVTGAVPEQQFSTLIPWMMEKYGKHRALYQSGSRKLLPRRLSLQATGRAGEGSTTRADLRALIAKGDVCVDAPEGKVCIDPKSQHVSHTIYDALKTLRAASRKKIE
jgi:hypothetical protein